VGIECFKYMFKHKQCMVVKTITVTENAYRSIVRLKKDTESFSDLFTRLGGAHSTARDIFGIMKLTDEESREFKQRVQAMRDELGKGLDRRMNDVRARLKRTHRDN